jgi:hypothetical protein
MPGIASLIVTLRPDEFALRGTVTRWSIRPVMLLWGLERQKWPPASSGSCSVQFITRTRMLFQRNPVGGSN